MDSLPFADALFKEYLSFRGLQQTLATFSQELAHDKACGFRPEGLSELLFGSLIPALAMDQVMQGRGCFQGDRRLPVWLLQQQASC